MNSRPRTLKEIAERSDSLSDFGHHLRDWLHELRRVSSRPQAAAAVADQPPQLRRKFAGGQVADAWLGAYGEHLAAHAGLPAPEWAFSPWRTSADPIFDEPGASATLRALALLQAPLAFKRRNIFTPSVSLPLRLRVGRPAKSAEERRKANAERQRRFRKARRNELIKLRKLAKRLGTMP